MSNKIFLCFLFGCILFGLKAQPAALEIVQESGIHDTSRIDSAQYEMAELRNDQHELEERIFNRQDELNAEMELLRLQMSDDIFYGIIIVSVLTVLIVALSILFYLKMKKELSLYLHKEIEYENSIGSLKEKIAEQDQTIGRLSDQISALKESTEVLKSVQKSEIVIPPEVKTPPRFHPETFYSNPNLEVNGFKAINLKRENINRKSCFEIYQYEPERASYTIAPEADLILAWEMIEGVLDYESKPIPGVDITVITDGELTLENGVWVVRKKLKVKTR